MKQKEREKMKISTNQKFKFIFGKIWLNLIEKKICWYIIELISNIVLKLLIKILISFFIYTRWRLISAVKISNITYSAIKWLLEHKNFDDHHNTPGPYQLSIWKHLKH